MTLSQSPHGVILGHKGIKMDTASEIRDLWGTGIRHLYISVLQQARGERHLAHGHKRQQTGRLSVLNDGAKDTEWDSDWHHVGSGDRSQDRDAEGISQRIGAAERMRKATFWEKSRLKKVSTPSTRQSQKALYNGLASKNLLLQMPAE